MAQTINLAPTTDAAISSEVVVPAGAQAVIGIYAATGLIQSVGGAYAAQLRQKTPGSINPITFLTPGQPSVIVQGPNTFSVSCPSGLTAVGVFSEQ